MNAGKEPRRSARAESIKRAQAAKKATATANAQSAAKKVVKRKRKTAKNPARLVAVSKKEYEVGKIVDSKMEGKKRFYLVQWRGYRPKHNTWEPEANLANSQEMIQQFDIKFPNKP